LLRLRHFAQIDQADQQVTTSESHCDARLIVMPRTQAIDTYLDEVSRIRSLPGTRETSYYYYLRRGQPAQPVTGEQKAEIFALLATRQSFGWKRL
jgi:hypothetical protein